jgi:hypothetical protein
VDEVEIGNIDDSKDGEGRATHDYRDIGGRVTSGAVTEDAYTDIGG